MTLVAVMKTLLRDDTQMVKTHARIRMLADRNMSDLPITDIEWLVELWQRNIRDSNKDKE